MNVNFKATRLVGAAAQVCVLVKDLEVINDYARLEAAAGEIGIDDTLLERALKQLEQVSYVRLKTAEGGRITRVQVSVPLLSSTYDGLGAIWESAKPSDFETKSMAVLDDACLSPLGAHSLVERYDIPETELPRIVELGQNLGYLGSFDHSPSGQKIIYSPLHFDEHPQKLIELAARHPAVVLSEALSGVRNEQGMPADRLDQRLVGDAIALGALYIPAVESMAGEHRFVFAPIKAYLPEQKTVLEKARAIVACVRYGQHYGTITAIRDPVALLYALKLRGRLSPHSEAVYQYRVLRDLGIADIRPSSIKGRYEVVIRKTPENVEALDLAISLATLGEAAPTTSRVRAAAASLTDGLYKPAVLLRADLVTRRKIRYSNELAVKVNSMIIGIPEEMA